MPWPLLFTNKHNIKNLDTSSNSINTSIEIDTNKEDNDKYNWHELRIEENNVRSHSLFFKQKMNNTIFLYI
jgi:hypothetical protein